MGKDQEDRIQRAFLTNSIEVLNRGGSSIAMEELMVCTRKELIETINLLMQPHMLVLKDPNSDREYQVAWKALQTYTHALDQVSAS